MLWVWDWPKLDSFRLAWDAEEGSCKIRIHWSGKYHILAGPKSLIVKKFRVAFSFLSCHLFRNSENSLELWICPDPASLNHQTIYKWEKGVNLALSIIANSIQSRTRNRSSEKPKEGSFSSNFLQMETFLPGGRFIKSQEVNETPKAVEVLTALTRSLPRLYYH